MNFYKLIYEIPAMLGLVVILRGLLPVELDDRLVPGYVAICCLIVLFVPVQVAIALAAAFAVGLILKQLKVPLTGHEPFVYPSVRLPAWPRRTVEHVYKAEPADDEPEAPAEDPVIPRKYIPDL
jgi:hypothetical protein